MAGGCFQLSNKLWKTASRSSVFVQPEEVPGSPLPCGSKKLDLSERIKSALGRGRAEWRERSLGTSEWDWEGEEEGKMFT